MTAPTYEPSKIVEKIREIKTKPSRLLNLSDVNVLVFHECE